MDECGLVCGGSFRMHISIARLPTEELVERFPAHLPGKCGLSRGLVSMVGMSRSSRFFVILLHLVGVSIHLPSGIVGVYPWNIVLETIDPQRSTEAGPLWLQESLPSNRCLDARGSFSECGDATSWLLVPEPSPKQQRANRRRQWKQWIHWALEEEDDETTDVEENQDDDPTTQRFAIQLVPDPSSYLASESGTSPSKSQPQSIFPWFRSYQQPPTLEEQECLVRRKRDNTLHLVTCSQAQSIYAWEFTSTDELQYDESRSRRSDRRRGLARHPFSLAKSTCLGQDQEGMAILGECNTDSSDDPMHASPSVPVTLLRQTIASPTDSAAFEESSITTVSLKESSTHKRQPNEDVSPRAGLPPSHVDLAHSHASDPAEHVPLKPHFRLARLSTNSATSEADSTMPLHLLHTSHPNLIDQPLWSPAKRNGATVGNDLSLDTVDHPETSRNSHRPPPRVFKIPTNPYIEASDHELWTDPQTGLVYPTDLRNFLGHDENSVGRHTLTGVGQYMKTVFNIKVYGVAFYVSKRDVLADPVMEKFAGLSSEELRERPDFFHALRTMSAPSSPGLLAGSFDRTLFLKTNMQISTEAMISSLDADWKLLTEEAKKELIGSSMRPRPATPQMLRVIESSENPSGCSCAQTAPEGEQTLSKEAEPACCARGTELVFTWRKNGALEVRLNGDLLESFDRSDIAEAIFFEYLRLDLPMSEDFLDRIVDGFPRLLAPLAQVKGVGSVHPSTHQGEDPSHLSPESTIPDPPTRGWLRPLEGVADIAMQGVNQITRLVPSQGKLVGDAVVGVGGWLVSGAAQAVFVTRNGVSHLGTVVGPRFRPIGEAARQVGDDLSRRRNLLGKHMAQFAHPLVAWVTNAFGSDDESTDNGLMALPQWLEAMPWEATHTRQRRQYRPNSWFLRIVAGWREESCDEIAPLIHPPHQSWKQDAFVIFTHCYLLLLLIASFPANWTTRTRLVLRGTIAKKRVMPIGSMAHVAVKNVATESTPQLIPNNSHCSISSTGSNSVLEREAALASPPVTNDGSIPKSFSYVL